MADKPFNWASQRELRFAIRLSDLKINFVNSRSTRVPAAFLEAKVRLGAKTATKGLVSRRLIAQKSVTFAFCSTTTRM